MGRYRIIVSNSFYTMAHSQQQSLPPLRSLGLPMPPVSGSPYAAHDPYSHGNPASTRRPSGRLHEHPGPASNASHQPRAAAPPEYIVRFPQAPPVSTVLSYGPGNVPEDNDGYDRFETDFVKNKGATLVILNGDGSVAYKEWVSVEQLLDKATARQRGMSMRAWLLMRAAGACQDHYGTHNPSFYQTLTIVGLKHIKGTNSSFQIMMVEIPRPRRRME